MSGLVERVSAGETICITGRGEPVAKLAPLEKPRAPVDIKAFRRVAAAGPLQEESAGELVRRMRDDERY